MANNENNNSKSKSIIIILLLIIIGGGISMFFFINSSNKPASVSKNMTLQNVTNNPNAIQQQGTVKTSDKVYSFKDEFVVNLSDEGGKRFLKSGIGIGYDSKNKKLEKELAGKDAILRDIIITSTRSKKTSDFSSKDIEKFKAELLTKMNSVLENGKVENIYFTNLLIQ